MNKNKVISIAIDGPPGAGKSTLALILAKKLDIPFLSSGALFRAFGYHCFLNKVDRFIEEQVVELLNKTTISVNFVGDKQQTFINGKCYNDFLYNPTSDMWSVDTAKYLDVRNKMVDVQRKFASNYSVIIEGRDIGSVVLPNATFKFYLDTDIKIRAKRRYDQYISEGKNVQFDEILSEMKDREYKEKHRQHSPLVVPKNAIVIDVNKTIKQIIDEMLLHIKGE